LKAPDAPTIGTATNGGATSVIVTFTAPSNTGAAPITSYTAYSTPDNLSITSATSPITFPILRNGISYTFAVVANNNAGSSVLSSSSNLVTPQATPGTPTIGTATASSSSSATVAYTAGAVGGLPTTSFTAVSTPGNYSANVTTSASGSITVGGLSAGTAYTFKVFATNAYGNSPLSASSNSITTPSTVYTPFRYVRWGANGSTSNPSTHFVELKATTWDTGANRMFGVGQAGRISQISGGGYEGGTFDTAAQGYITDNDTTNYSGFASGGATLQFDLGAIYNDISNLVFWNYYADGRTYNSVFLQISSDGSNFTTVFGPQSNASNSGGTNINITRIS
jgi:hypothetical protein